MPVKEDLPRLQEELKGFSASEVIAWASKTFGNDISLASSFGLEDQVLSALCVNEAPNFRIFTLDTGRVFQETYDTMEETAKQYGINYEVVFPQREAVENLLHTKGPNSFYKSIENRKERCNIRKMEPLRRALSNTKAWVCGLRKEQSITRTDMNIIEWDATFEIFKFNPLINWTEDDCWKYIKDNNVPYNKLHDTGFPSIGCRPCTRAIEPGDDIRSGRWWWETPEQKECGLHVVDGKLVRKSQ